MDANLISKIQSKKTQKINTKETEGGDIRERGERGFPSALSGSVSFGKLLG